MWPGGREMGALTMSDICLDRIYVCTCEISPL